MLYNDRGFDWETREDANTLKRFMEIQNNPERLRKAKACIQESVDSGKAALGLRTPPPQPGRRNPATIMRLDTKKF